MASTKGSFQMTGDILIVDSISSNRIVLKVKLSSAFYSIFQASTAQEALSACAREKPDLILVSSELADMAFGDFVDRIKACPEHKNTPVIALINDDNAETRLRLFRLGATDVISEPGDDAVLLARLRTILRDTHGQADLGLQPDTAEVLGFSEKSAAFARRGRIAALLPRMARQSGTRHVTQQKIGFYSALASKTAHQIERYDMPAGGALRQLKAEPDAVLLDLGNDPSAPNLGLLSALRTAPKTRNAKIIALTDYAKAPIAAAALDMGAHDVIDFDTHITEVDLRLNRQIRRKLDDDRILAGLRTGLRAAVTDPLTGLYNRRFGMSQLDRLMVETAQSAGSMAVILADLDHFKWINDRFGHAVGDAVLKEVSRLITSELRNEGIVARIGGEEFLILLPGVSDVRARQVAQRIRRAVSKASLTVGGGIPAIDVTVSLGGAIADCSDHQCPPMPETMFQLADQALYGSKSNGRNTVTFR